MLSAQVWSGVAQGLGQVSKDLSQADLKAAQLSEAKAKQQKAQLELKEFNSNAPTRERTSELELQQLEAETKSLNRASLNTATISAMDRYNVDGNVKHLNTWLRDSKKNPVGANIYGEVARYDALTKTDTNDKLLRQAGYNPDDIYSDKESVNDFIVVTQNNGNQLLLPKEQMFAATRYTDYLDDKQLKKMEAKARIGQMLRSGQSRKTVNMKERVVQDLVDTGKAATIAEAYQMLLEMEKSSNGKGTLSSNEERAVNSIMEEKNVGYVEALDIYYSTKRQGTGTTNESRFITEYLDNNPEASYEQAAAEYRNITKTTTQKEVGDVKELRQGLDEMGWLTMSQKDMDPVQRSRVYRDYISPLEDLRNFKLSTEDKRTVRQLRELTALGGTAGTELTPEETGLLDSTINNFKKYMFNEVGGKKATASYETFRNLFRNSLYGSALTDNEIKAFNKAAGTLGQQFQPVMAQLKVQMNTIKDNLESIRDLNDPDIAHYYTGKSIEEIDQAIMAMEERMNDPRLQGMTAAQDSSGSGVTVKRVKDNAEPVVPNTDGNVDSDFDFDAAMDEAGL